jgi:hypothetical protein
MNAPELNALRQQLASIGHDLDDFDEGLVISRKNNPSNSVGTYEVLLLIFWY